MRVLLRAARRYAPAATAAAFAAAAVAERRDTASCELRGVTPAVHKELTKLRSGEVAMLQKWEEDEMKWHQLPPRAWPPTQPKPDEVDRLSLAAAACPAVSSQTLTAECTQAHFDLATCLAFNLVDPAEGLRQYRALAEAGHLDSMVAVGVVQLEGIGIDIDEASNVDGVKWIQRASELGHAQAQYELGCLHYLGSLPELVPEDEAAAYMCFERAANQNHTSALFMQAECLLEGTGVKRDHARAVPLLYNAAERGHRMARQYVREWLDEDAAIGAEALGSPPRNRHQAPDESGAAGAAASKSAASDRLAKEQRLASQQLAQEQAALLPALPEDGGKGAHAHLGCFTGAGEPISLDDIVRAVEGADVVLVGECHDDPIAHVIEAYFLVSLAARRPCRLSLEMFETDVQSVVDEYLAGLIREKDLEQDGRVWANYHDDYRPLIEFAKHCQLPVTAANAPRRYVGAIGRDEATLRERPWPQAAYERLPPLPLPSPSAAYMRHLMSDPAVMRMDQIGLDSGGSTANDGGGGGECSGGGDGGGEGEVSRCPYVGLDRREGLVQPMLLWDATMAHSIARSLRTEPDRLVLHVCGSFHCERRLGARAHSIRQQP